MKARPLLRWHGGKWLLAEWIISYFPQHRRYIEPFGGAASVLLRKRRCYEEVYNDLDGEIVSLFRVARDHGPELARLLELTPFSREEFFASYEPTDDPLERARRTVIRSFQGYGSNAHNAVTGFRGKSRSSGTTAAHDWRNYPAALALTIERLRGVVIEQRPAIDVILTNDSDDALFYVDPPYVHSTRSKTKGYRFELTDDDHSNLAAVLHRVSGGVVVSGYRCDIYSDLYADWRRVDRATHADGARDRVESLWLSPRCWQPSLFERLS